eukprot:jgi/Botrbrau1/893/Bobra.0167s0016.1
MSRPRGIVMLLLMFVAIEAGNAVAQQKARPARRHLKGARALSSARSLASLGLETSPSPPPPPPDAEYVPTIIKKSAQDTLFGSGSNTLGGGLSPPPFSDNPGLGGFVSSLNGVITSFGQEMKLYVSLFNLFTGRGVFEPLATATGLFIDGVTGALTNAVSYLATTFSPILGGNISGGGFAFG